MPALPAPLAPHGVALNGVVVVRSRLRYSDAEYFNLSKKDARIATARRERPSPTLEQVRHVLSLMPDKTAIEQRNRAVIAFTLLSGARDGAIASMRLKHVDLEAGSVFQDARDVKTKFSKTFTTYFFPVGNEVRRIVDDWVVFLKQQMLWGHDDPLFPATLVELGEERQFEATGLSRRQWATTSPIRQIFRRAFESAGLQYFNPHSLRATLVQLGQTMCSDAEQFKAWSQNLGHEDVLTTILSYGLVAPRRQGQIMETLGRPRVTSPNGAGVVAQAVVDAIRSAGLLVGED